MTAFRTTPNPPGEYRLPLDRSKVGPEYKGFKNRVWTWELDLPQINEIEGCDAIWVLPAKSGCTTVRSMIMSGHEEYFDGPAKSRRVSRPEMAQRQLGGTPVIMVTRHPLARVVSAWHNKFSHIPFSQFVAQITAIPDEHIDIHAQSQSFLVRDGTGGYLTPDYRYDISELSRMAQELRGDHRGGVAPWLSPVAPVTNSTGKGNKWETLLDDRTKARLSERYAEDLRLWYE